MSEGEGVPPELEGFTHQRRLGGGGFADVFLYRHHKLDRDVAMKVLKRELVTAQSLEQFAIEANLMAKVAEHSTVVTIHDTLVAPDPDGRPCIVMEYCPLPNFSERVATGPLRVDEVLHVGVQISSAVEAAHRAGILHRDIKPANILTNRSRLPRLTDFGIASVVTGDTATAALGVSPPWAPPEALRPPPSVPWSVLVTSDVYSLAATLYHLLAGHSPFCPPGASRDRDDIVERVLAGGPRWIDRPNLPDSLNHLLARAMSIDPALRPRTARDLADSLRSIQQELLLTPTTFEELDIDEGAGAPSRAPEQPGERTILGHEGLVVAPVAPVAPIAPVPPVVEPLRRLEDTDVEPLPEQQGGGDAEEDEDEDGHAASRRPTLVLGGVAAAVVVLALVVASAVLGGSDGGSDADATTTTAPDQATAPDVAAPGFGPPTAVDATYDPEARTLEVTWTAPGGAEDDAAVRYRVYRRDAESAPDDLQRFLEGSFTPGVDGTTATFTDVPDDVAGACVTVATISGGSEISEESPVACAAGRPGTAADPESEG